MTDADRVARIFCDAMNLPAPERSAFLDRECGADDALRAELDSLLAADDNAHRFLEPMREGGEGKDPNIGKTLGAWRLVRAIGSGGMGHVYLAERADPAFEMKAAVKVIRGGLWTDALLRRFDHERRVLAGLEHPNIARLIDGGTTDEGVPFLVMEYVEGTAIDRYCDDTRLSLTERLQLFRNVCSAVQHAHRNLVVHRDLKPSNVLVTKEGSPKLLDFGIAKVLEAEGGGDVTETAARALTPRYASPEQIVTGSVTTTSDVYSLGVVLFELLTGGRPYDTERLSPREMERAITEIEPTRPSAAVQASLIADREGGKRALSRRLSGDLDNIVLMALRKEPDRRYGSVEQFSEDIRKHLDGFPVIARPDTLVYRTTKFVVRNRALVGAAAALVLALVAGAAVSVHFALREREQRAIADARFEDGRELAATFLIDVDNAIATEGKTAARERIVSTSVAYLDELAAAPGDDPRVLRDVARGYFRVAAIQGDPKSPSLGDAEAALVSARKGQDIARRLSVVDPVGRESILIAVEADLLAGDLSRHLGNLDATIEHFRAALVKRERLSETDPGAELLPPRLDTVHFQLAYALERLSQPGESIEHFERAAAIGDDLTARYPGRPDLYQSKVVTLTALSQAYRFQGRPEMTIELLAPLLVPLAEEARQHAALRPVLANLRYNLGWTYVSQGDTARGEEEITGSMEFYRGLAEADPDDITAHRNTASLLHDLGELADLGARHDQAIGYYEELLRLRRHILSRSPGSTLFRSDLALALTVSGEVLWKLGRRREALDRHVEAGEILAGLVVEHPDEDSYRQSAADVKHRTDEMRND